MLALLLALVLPVPAEQPFAVQVVDEQTGRGVPLIELRSVNHLRFVTDSQGLVALDDPEWMGQEVYLSVSGHGYEYPADGFGYRGVKVKPTPGGSHTVKVKRKNLAERLYRITGEGVYAESLKLGRLVPFRNPGRNAQIVGCDSVIMTPYRGKLFWVWGDTSRAAYPLGNFHTTAATTPKPGPQLDPDRGVEFSYLTDGKGFVKGVAPMPGAGPTWVESLVTLPDASSIERLWACYVKVKGLTPTARVLARYDDEKQLFVPVQDWALNAPAIPRGHGVQHEGYLYFGSPVPIVRVPASEAAFRDPTRYECWSCLKPGSTLERPEVDRDRAGLARFAWRPETVPLDGDAQAKLVRSGVLKPAEATIRVLDTASGKSVRMHNGTVNWNAYRKKWVLIANEIGGQPSFLGEVWYAEAPQLTGPWVLATKIVTHQRMDFYNPKQHPEFDRDGGRVIYFEGTYTNMFSGNPDQTPRYEYNQVMYKLDLADERLHGKTPKSDPGRR